VSPSRTTTHVPLALLAAAAALLVAACGASASPAASAAPSTAPIASPSPVPSGAADSPAPSVDLHGAPDLEARLPHTVGSTELSAVSLSGDTFLSTGDTASQGQLRDMLSKLGRTPADLSVAEAHDPTGRLVYQLGLFRVAGADAFSLESAWIAAQQAADANRLKVTQETIAGRQVTHLADPARVVGGDTYVVAMGDTLVLVLADDTTLVEETLGDFK
jgi:nucleoid-associated protein YgaU